MSSILKKLPLSRIYLLAVIATTFVVMAYFLSQREEVRSKARILSHQNRFQLQFDIAAEDKDTFSKFLENSRLPVSLNSGVYFELDSTSSAALAFVSPIEADLEISSKSIKAQGPIKAALVRPAQALDCTVPKDTTLMIYAKGLSKVTGKIVKVPEELLDWIAVNFNSDSSQCLFFSKDSWEFVLFSQDKSQDLESLKNLDFAKKEDVYKKELQDDVELHLLKLPQDVQEEAEKSLAFFKTKNLIALSSSPQLAKEFIQQEKEGNFESYPNDPQRDLVYKVIFQDDSKNTQNLPEFLQKIHNDLSSLLTNTKSVDFSLMTDSFSVLINLK